MDLSSNTMKAVLFLFLKPRLGYYLHTTGPFVFQIANEVCLGRGQIHNLNGKN